MSNITLQIEDSGRTIRVASGDEVLLSLAETPTTGYRWNGPLLAGVAVIVAGNRFVPPSPSPSAAGAAGRRLISLKAVLPGQVLLSAQLERPWHEPGAAPINSFSVTIVVGIGGEVRP